MLNKNLVTNCILGFIVVTACAGCARIGKTAKTVGSIPSKAGKIIWNISSKTGKAIKKLPSKTGDAIWNFPSFAGDTIWNFPSNVLETTKVILGTSTRALENARDEALTKTYQCSIEDCYNAVLALGRKNRIYRDYLQEDEDDSKSEEAAANQPIDGGYFYVFLKDRAKRHIVVMGIQGNVDTTEAGIFFSQPTLTTVKLEVSSLSSNAKRSVADIVFNNLASKFSTSE